MNKPELDCYIEQSDFDDLQVFNIFPHYITIEQLDEKNGIKSLCIEYRATEKLIELLKEFTGEKD